MISHETNDGVEDKSIVANREEDIIAAYLENKFGSESSQTQESESDADNWGSYTGEGNDFSVPEAGAMGHYEFFPDLMKLTFLEGNPTTKEIENWIREELRCEYYVQVVLINGTILDYENLILTAINGVQIKDSNKHPTHTAQKLAKKETQVQ